MRSALLSVFAICLLVLFDCSSPEEAGQSVSVDNLESSVTAVDFESGEEERAQVRISERVDDDIVDGIGQGSTIRITFITGSSRMIPLEVVANEVEVVTA